ncbi:MAG TPA: hypothetical protein VHK69_11190 [Chitinophagaceae bacterium]|jgi:hypothetical protein|nr:hypothetical protein [Chitinophagaceae bacterium]
MSVDQDFTRVVEKLQLLLRQHQRVRREAERLRAELERARRVTEAQAARTAELEQQIAIMKFAAGEMNDSEKKAFEKQLNQYVREIDRCIAFLSQ